MTRSVRLFLKKVDEAGQELESTLDLDFSPRGLARAATEIRRHMSEGWKLVNAEGDPQLSTWIKGEVSRYDENPKEYRASVKGTVKLATKIVKPKGKISAKKVLKAASIGTIKTKAQKIRDKFRRRKKLLKEKEQTDNGAEESQPEARSHP